MSYRSQTDYIWLVGPMTDYLRNLAPSLSCSNGSWIYSSMYNQGLSPLKLWARIPLRRGVFDTTLCDKFWQWLATGQWFSLVSSTNITDHHDITDILLQVALNTITLRSNKERMQYSKMIYQFIMVVHSLNVYRKANY